MRTGLARWWVRAIVAVAVGALAACGGGGAGKPDPTPTPDPPVSVRMNAIDTYARGTDGLLALSVHTKGTHPPKATVTLRFDVPTGKSLKTQYEPPGSTSWDGWPDLQLTRSAGPKAGLDTLTGRYTVPLDDNGLWRVRLDPQYGPSRADDAVAVHVSLSSAGHTLATDSVQAPLAAVTVTEVGANGHATALHRSGTWSEATYEVRNNSTRDIASLNAGLDISPCDADTVTSCDPTGGQVADDFAVQRYDGHRWVPAGPGNGSAVRVLSTALKAGATVRVRVRVRVAPGSGLGKDIERVNIGLAAAGKMPGAKTASFDSSTQTYDIAR
ncbi:MAG: hypothetical protein HOY69_32840 [Streptomyces sp.]|nr:hypothetical protein [Streptomyces sp.]